MFALFINSSEHSIILYQMKAECVSYFMTAVHVDGKGTYVYIRPKYTTSCKFASMN